MHTSARDVFVCRPRPESDTLDDIESDIGHLYHLMGRHVDDLVAFSGDQGATSPEEFDRIVSLAWVMRDLVQNIRHDISKHYMALSGRSTISTSGPAHSGGGAA